MPAGLKVGITLEIEQGIEQREQREQLQQKEKVAPEPLEQAVDLGILNGLAPQEGARHGQRLALQLEEIEQEEQERQQAEEESGPQGQGPVIAEAEVVLQPAVDGIGLAAQVQDEQD